MYRIVFAGWSNPRRVDLSGYNAWDYLSGNVPSAFATRTEAASWLRSHRLGKDRYGVSAKFKVAKGSSNPCCKNPTKAQKREKTRKASVQRRVAVALAKFLKQANPAMKTSGAQVQRLKGGVLKITPIKANAGGKYRWTVQRWDDGGWRRVDPSLDTKAAATRTAAIWRRGGWKVRVVRSGAY